RCARAAPTLDAVAPVSYSVAHEQLHHALSGYKRPPDVVAQRFQIELAAVLWRYLELHEACRARTADTNGFQALTAVPPTTPERGPAHPLHRIVGDLVRPTRDRYERLLRRSTTTTQPHQPDPHKFEVVRDLGETDVLLIDDTCTTGANARSAAAALKAA